MPLGEEGSLRRQNTADLRWVPLLRWLWKHSCPSVWGPMMVRDLHQNITEKVTVSLNYMKTVVLLSHWDLGTTTTESSDLAYLCIANGILHPVWLYNTLYRCVLVWNLLVDTNMTFLNLPRGLWHERQIYQNQSRVCGGHGKEKIASMIENEHPPPRSPPSPVIEAQSFSLACSHPE